MGIRSFLTDRKQRRARRRYERDKALREQQRDETMERVAKAMEMMGGGGGGGGAG